jgi:hypothetical protein
LLGLLKWATTFGIESALDDVRTIRTRRWAERRRPCSYGKLVAKDRPMSLSRFCIAAAIAVGLSLGAVKPASAGWGDQTLVLAYYTYLYSYQADQDLGDTDTALAYLYSYYGQIYAHNGMTVNRGYFYASYVYFNIVNNIATNGALNSGDLYQYYSSYFSFYAYQYAWYAYMYGP